MQQGLNLGWHCCRCIPSFEKSKALWLNMLMAAKIQKCQPHIYVLAMDYIKLLLILARAYALTKKYDQAEAALLEAYQVGAFCDQRGQERAFYVQRSQESACSQCNTTLNNEMVNWACFWSSTKGA